MCVYAGTMISPNSTGLAELRTILVWLLQSTISCECTGTRLLRTLLLKHELRCVLLCFSSMNVRCRFLVELCRFHNILDVMKMRQFEGRAKFVECLCSAWIVSMAGIEPLETVILFPWMQVLSYPNFGCLQWIGSLELYLFILGSDRLTQCHTHHIFSKVWSLICSAHLENFLEVMKVHCLLITWH